MREPEPPEDLNSIEIEVFSDVQSELDEHDEEFIDEIGSIFN
ncbi:hypothetical protein [Klebsiella pneumoniae]